MPYATTRSLEGTVIAITGASAGIGAASAYDLVGAGAKVLGNITVSHGAQVGANAVVTKDVPSMAVATGIPAKIRHPDLGVDPQHALYDEPALWI